MPNLWHDGPGGDERLKMAQKLVKRQHPKRKTPLVEVLPFLAPISCCWSCCTRNGDRADNFSQSQADGGVDEGGEDDQKE